jgi:hypothetical protein
MGSVGWERAMKIQEVILRAMAKRITWWQAAEIIGMRDQRSCGATFNHQVNFRAN